MKILLLELVKSVWAQVLKVKNQGTTVPNQNCEIEFAFYLWFMKGDID